jgi:hypothetical protein
MDFSNGSDIVTRLPRSPIQRDEHKAVERGVDVQKYLLQLPIALLLAVM